MRVPSLTSPPSYCAAMNPISLPPPPPQEIAQSPENAEGEAAVPAAPQTAEAPAATAAPAAPEEAAPAETAEPVAPAPQAEVPAPAAPEVAAVAPAEEEPAPASAEPGQAAAPGSGFRVQLAAVKSEADAQQAWAKLQKAHADLLGGLQPTIQRADLGAQGIFYRVQGGPLPTREAAAALCEGLKAKNQACLVVKP